MNFRILPAAIVAASLLTSEGFAFAPKCPTLLRPSITLPSFGRLGNCQIGLSNLRSTALDNDHLGVEVQEQLSNVRLTDEGKIVRISFSDDSTYNFHSLWLRDACRDERHVAAKAGERILAATTIVGADPDANTVTFDDLRATEAKVSADSTELTVHWNIDESNGSGSIDQSVFDVSFLKRYASAGVAQCVSGNEDNMIDESKTQVSEWNHQDDIPTWLEPYTGYPDARAPVEHEMISWSNLNVHEDEDGEGSYVEFERYQYDDLMNESDSPELLLDMIKTLLEQGAVLIDGAYVPDDGESDLDKDAADKLRNFIAHTLGGLQKDPTRSEPNWKIVNKPGSSSISYNPSKRLNQHTDSSIPPHGIPGLVLSMHYIKGSGANTLTDGFEIAKVLKAENPEGYDLLTIYGYDGERDFAASRIDSTQSIAKGLVVNRRHPIFVNNEDGKLTRIQYNEVFRMPSTLPFDLFPKWYSAFSRFCELLHSEEYQQTLPMKAGTILLVNNWRVLHGRAGGRASPDRHLVGGTILRESVYSRAMQLARYLKNGERGE